jgi:hypothetical protein
MDGLAFVTWLRILFDFAFSPDAALFCSLNDADLLQEVMSAWAVFFRLSAPEVSPFAVFCWLPSALAL